MFALWGIRKAHLKQLQLHQRDVWHVFQQAAKVQGRLETLICHKEERLRTLTRYEQRQAQGGRITGRPPRTSAEQQHQVVEQLMQVWAASPDFVRRVAGLAA